MPADVFIGIPAKGAILPECFMSMMNPGNTRCRIEFSRGGVDVAHECNALWCMAVNSNLRKYSHLALHHTDVEAPSGWLDIMVAEMDRVGADILSAIISLKDDRGVTSTAVCNYHEPSRRLTLKQAHRLPETFNLADIDGDNDGFLGINTGLILFRFTNALEWVRQGFCFHIDNRIEELEDGTVQPVVMPEDWNIGEFAYSKGLKVFVTRKLDVGHYDLKRYDNSNRGSEQDPGEAFPPAA